MGNEQLPMLDHGSRSESWQNQGTGPSDLGATESLIDANNKVSKQRQIGSSPLAIIIHGLPENTTDTNLRTLMAWSYDFREAQMIPSDPDQSMLGFKSAVFYFSSHASTNLAQQLFNGKANIDATAYLRVEFATEKAYISEVTTVEGFLPGKTRRHKWSDSQVAYLQEKYRLNPKPSTAAKKEVAAQLGVRENHVHTWYNNARQRQKSRASREIPVGSRTTDGNPNFSLSRERLEMLSKERSSSKSPIERFATSLMGCRSDPSPEVIKAAAKNSRLTYPPTTPIHLGNGYRPSSFDSGDGASTSSAGSITSSHSNVSFRSTGSNEFRRRRKAYRRATSAMQQPRKDICVELDCTECESTMSFQLMTHVTVVTCLNCNKQLGTFSVAHGLSASFIKVVCPIAECNHRNYHTTTREAEDKIVRVACLCEQYNPWLILSDWVPGTPVRRYHCTFCRKSYHSRYGWERHETTKHRPKEVWICCDSNPLHDNACIFCSQENPTTEHFDGHRYDRCHQRDLSLRTYYRKDQFVVHLRAFHRCTVVREELIATWRSELDNDIRRWQCGICEEYLWPWSHWLKHIANHWEKGLTMSDWALLVMNEEEPPQPVKNRLSVNGLWNTLKSVLPRI